MLWSFFLGSKDPAADATDAQQPWGLLCNPVMEMISFFVFPCTGGPVEWNWQGKTEVLEEKLTPVPLCPLQIPHGVSRHRTRASLMRGRQLTAWAVARPNIMKLHIFKTYLNLNDVCITLEFLNSGQGFWFEIAILTLDRCVTMYFIFYVRSL
jgi:hypothetical protein